MNTYKNALQSINPVRFVILIVVIYLLLSQGNLFMNSVLSPNGRFFNAFLYEHLNYIQWLRNALIVPSIGILNFAGFETLVSKHEILVIGGIKLNINYSCLGLGAMSFIVAYVCAFPKTFKKKIQVILIASTLVYVLNILRIAGLGIIFSSFKTQRASLTYHHEVFNILIFVVIIVILYRWIKWNLKTPPNP